MKKTIASSLILSAFGLPAMSQTTTTVYGLVDLSLQHLRAGDSAPNAGGTQTRLADGHLYGPGSRLGFRVAEDLGGGLKALAVLESGFTADTGTLAQGGRGFGRQSYVGLSSVRVGEIRLGRQYILHDEVMAINNPYASTSILNPGSLQNTMTSGQLPLFIDAPRIDNAIHYLSPVWNGFRVQAMVAPGEVVADRYHGVKLSYLQGPLVLAGSYEQSRTNAVAGGYQSSETVNRILELGGNYDFGFVKGFAGYQQGKDLKAGSAVTLPNTGGVGTQIPILALPAAAAPNFGAITELRAYTLGALAPITSLTTLGVNYTQTAYRNAAGDNRTLGLAAVGMVYNMSKQTALYGALGIHTGDLREHINEKTVIQVGLRKAF